MAEQDLVREIDPESIDTARTAIIKDLNAGALVVSARHVRLLLAGFDHLLDAQADVPSRLQRTAEQARLSMVGLVLYALGLDEVTITGQMWDELVASNQGVTVDEDADERTLTYRLAQREVPAETGGDEA